MHLDLVEARRRRRRAHEPVDANNAAPPRQQRVRVEQTARTHVLCLYALAGVASPDELRDVADLPRPGGEPAHQGRHLVPTKVASERGVVALLENAMSQMTTIRDAEPACFALAAPIDKSHRKERASRWSSRGWGHLLSLPVDHASHCRCRAVKNGSEKGVGVHLALQGCDKVWREELPRERDSAGP